MQVRAADVAAAAIKKAPAAAVRRDGLRSAGLTNCHVTGSGSGSGQARLKIFACHVTQFRQTSVSDRNCEQWRSFITDNWHYMS